MVSVSILLFRDARWRVNQKPGQSCEAKYNDFLRYATRQSFPSWNNGMSLSSVNPVIVAKKSVSHPHVLTIDLVITLMCSITMGAKLSFTARSIQIRSADSVDIFGVPGPARTCG